MRAGIFLILALCLLINCCDPTSLEDAQPHTTVLQGCMRGKWMTTRGGRKIAGFLGIPYAVAPVGELRFKSPVPSKPWPGGVYNATSAGPPCIQISSPTCSEDCLYLNVYTPDVNGKNYAVIVFLHGGHYEVGNGGPTNYGPDYMLDEDIILVTINYRVGLLGFLSLEHPVLPGNLALKDQRAALRWVKYNIEYFGGNSNKVTLFGESAGGASASYHHIFTAKEGLFRAVILSSKSAMSVSAFQPPRSQKPLVDIIAKESKCPRHPELLVECLKKLPAEAFITLLNKTKEAPLSSMLSTTRFCPVIEPACVSDKLVTEDPYDKYTDMPLMVGNNEYEGLFNLVEFEKDGSDNLLSNLNNNCKQALQFNLQLTDYCINPEQVVDSVREYYFQNRTIDRAHFIQLADMYSDNHYNMGNVIAARNNKAKTYYYRHMYRGSNSYVHFMGSKAYYGVSHADDLFFFFPMGGPSKRNITDEDTKLSKIMVKMWTNFAKCLDPTPDDYPIKWEPVRTSNIEYLNIGQTGFSMKSNFLKERVSFWDNLPYRNKPEAPVPPYWGNRNCMSEMNECICE